MDVARSGLASLIDLQRELEEAAQEMAEAEDEADRDRASRRYDELHEQLEHQDAYSIDHRVEEILDGLRFTAARLRPSGPHVLRRPAVAADARQAACSRAPT